mgnify:FL=1
MVITALLVGGGLATRSCSGLEEELETDIGGVDAKKHDSLHLQSFLQQRRNRRSDRHDRGPDQNLGNMISMGDSHRPIHELVSALDQQNQTCDEQ